jgi:hypothetical protein
MYGCHFLLTASAAGISAATRKTSKVRQRLRDTASKSQRVAPNAASATTNVLDTARDTTKKTTNNACHST